MRLSTLFLLLCLLCTAAFADEPAAQAPTAADCSITSDYKVEGNDTLPCVEKLETAARLARAEWRVNKGMKRKQRR